MEKGQAYNPEDFALSGTFNRMPKPLTFNNELKSYARGYPEFKDRLGSYLAREMTYPSDALNAFAGISNLFSKALSTQMLSGLPVAFFDIAILWTPAQPTILRNDGFPSWSCAGWHGSGTASCPGYTASSFLVRHTWIQWNTYWEATGQSIPLQRILVDGHEATQEHTMTISESYRDYIERTNYDELEGFERKWELKEGSQDDIENGKRSAIEGVISYVRTSTLIPDMSSALPLGPGILRFFSLSAIFDVVLGVTTGPSSSSISGDYHLLIQDCSGSSVGQLNTSYGDAKEYLHANPELLGRHKFILLSEGRSLRPGYNSSEQYKHFVQEYVEGGDRVVETTERLPIVDARALPR